MKVRENSPTVYIATLQVIFVSARKNIGISVSTYALCEVWPLLRENHRVAEKRLLAIKRRHCRLLVVITLITQDHAGLKATCNAITIAVWYLRSSEVSNLSSMSDENIVPHENKPIITPAS